MFKSVGIALLMIFSPAAPASDGSLPARTVLVGSSSIQLWPEDLRKDLGRQVTNLGVGGTGVDYFLSTVSRIVESQPQAVIVYTGENDLADGLEVADVAGKILQGLLQLHEKLPRARIVYVSIKPSPYRAEHTPTYARANRRLRDLIEEFRSPRLRFADIFTPMLDHPSFDGLFLVDKLHMNDAGYALWLDVLKPLLE